MKRKGSPFWGAFAVMVGELLAISDELLVKQCLESLVVG
jgi:hypothetical protein